MIYNNTWIDNKQNWENCIKKNRKFNIEIELIKKNSQTEVLEFNNTMTNLKKSIKNFNFTWKIISKLEDSPFEIIQTEEQK